MVSVSALQIQLKYLASDVARVITVLIPLNNHNHSQELAQEEADQVPVATAISVWETNTAPPPYANTMFMQQARGSVIPAPISLFTLFNSFRHV